MAGAITVEGGSGIDTLDLDDTGDTRRRVPLYPLESADAFYAADEKE